MIVKICGITNTKDAENALLAGADWIGLNLVGGPRQLSLAKTEEMLQALGDANRCVALVSTQATDFASTVGRLRDWGLHRLQVYHHAGSRHESLRDCEMTVVQHVAMNHTPQELADQLDGIDGDPAYVLLDAAAKNQLGGTGKSVDWDLLAEAMTLQSGEASYGVLLAGGLKPGNVAEAINKVQPTGVDVSSGVEATVGRKDPSKMADFVLIAKAAGAS